MVNPLSLDEQVPAYNGITIDGIPLEGNPNYSLGSNEVHPYQFEISEDQPNSLNAETVFDSTRGLAVQKTTTQKCNFDEDDCYGDCVSS